jgi:hypothetical protein
MVGVRLRNICNFIDNLKNKNSNKKDKDQMWRRNKL